MLSSRNESILYSLDKLRFATRDQLQQIHSLGSDRNALKVLRQVAEYVHIKTHYGRNVYYLNQKGRELVGSDQEVAWSLQVDHHLMRNDMYVYLGCPKEWHVEQPIRFKVQEGLMYKDMTITPDATYKIEGKLHFLEVDRTQSMKENKKKMETYRKLSPLIQQQFGYAPKVVFYSLSTVRSKKLRELMPDARVYAKEDI